MAALSTRIKQALDEARILVLGSQILVGFQFRSFFELGFADLPRWARCADLAALLLLTGAFGALVLPGAYHGLVLNGRDEPGLLAVTTRALASALLPFALALGIATGIAARRGGSDARAAVVGCAAALSALAFWYALPALCRRDAPQEQDMPDPSLSKRIDQVLTELRTALPGAQALLGFQLAATLTGPYAALPRTARAVHLFDVLLTGLGVVLLMAPAAWHRLAERGEESERFHRIASRFLIAALLPLALALAGQLAIASTLVLEGAGAPVALGAATLLLLLVLWYALPLRARRRRARRQR